MMFDYLDIRSFILHIGLLRRMIRVGWIRSVYIFCRRLLGLAVYGGRLILKLILVSSHNRYPRKVLYSITLSKATYSCAW